MTAAPRPLAAGGAGPAAAAPLQTGRPIAQVSFEGPAADASTTPPILQEGRPAWLQPGGLPAPLVQGAPPPALPRLASSCGSSRFAAPVAAGYVGSGLMGGCPGLAPAGQPAALATAVGMLSGAAPPQAVMQVGGGQSMATLPACLLAPQPYYLALSPALLICTLRGAFSLLAPPLVCPVVKLPWAHASSDSAASLGPSNCSLPTAGPAGRRS